jgi:EAL domain-containing protein (putative c-di-GMP-specific phosphodiesterase class I)
VLDHRVDPRALLAEDDRLDDAQARRLATQIEVIRERRSDNDGRDHGHAHGNGNGHANGHASGNGNASRHRRDGGFSVEVLARVRSELLAGLNPGLVEQRIVDEVLKAFPVANGASVEIAAPGGAPWLVRTHAGGVLAATRGRRQRLLGTVAGLALRAGRLQRCDDAELLTATDCLTNVDGVGSVVCVPLQRSPGFCGVLTLTSPRRNGFAEEDLTRLTELAQFVAALIGAARDVAGAAAQMLTRRDDAPPVSMAAFVAGTLGQEIDDHVRRALVAERIRSVITDRPPTVQFQPIADLRDGNVVGYEALARFSATPRRSPDVWFGEAATVGLGTDLEMVAVSNALDHMDRLPPGAYLAVNVSPDTAASAEFAHACRGAPADSLVIELTEHAPVVDYPELTRALAGLRTDGVRLAIDDAGAGFASLRHVLRLQPDIIKLDLALTRGIDTDPVRQALATALISFAGEVGAVIVAEGVESRWEAEALRELGVAFGQGWYVARPGPLPSLATAS